MHLRSVIGRSPLVLFVLLISFPFCLISNTHAQVSFFTPPTYTGSATAFVADFSGDGKPDILSADGTLQFGNGDGSFTPGTSVAGGVLAVADFNGDGKPDVLQQGTGTLIVLLGNGNGTFQPAISTASGASLTTIAAGDLNGDGKADVLGLFNNNLLVYLSKGDGTFASGVPYLVGNTSIGLAPITLRDFNGDHVVDVAVSLSGNNVPGQEVVLLGNGDGTFKSAKTSTGVLYPSSAVTGDFNNDGKLDLVISSPPPCIGTCVTSILLGNGDGTFQAPATIFSGDGTLAAADLNGDGKLDLVFLSTLVQIYLGNGDGTFSNTHSYRPPPDDTGGSLSLAVADFDLDGKLDIAAAGFVFLGNNNGTFQGWVATSAGAQATAVGDFDKNGTQDVAAVEFANANNLDILTNDGTGSLVLMHTYTLQEPGYGIATSDLNADSNLDLIVIGTDPITQEWGYSVLLGNGDGSFQSPVFYPQNITTAASHYSIIVADFNNDHKLDVATSLGGIGGNQSLALLLGNSDGTFGSPAYVYDGGATDLVAADFNGDGNTDIAAEGNVAGTGALQTALLFGKGDGTFQAATFPLGQYGGEFTADFNNDGKADLLGMGSNGDQALLGNGDGTFSPAAPFSPASPPEGLFGIADINGDGKLDVIASAPIGLSSHGIAVGINLGSGTGTFGAFLSIMSFSNFGSPAPIFLEAVDMNGDGKPDLIVVDSLPSIFVVPNTTKGSLGLTAASTTASVSAGSPANYNLSIGGAGWSGQAALTCSIVPAATGAACSVLPTNIAVSARSTSSLTVTVTTTSRIMASLVVPPHFKFSPWLWAVALMGFVILPASPRKHFSKRKSSLSKYMRALPLLLIFLFPACGGGGTSSGGGSTGPQTNPNGTPAGTYTVTVTATPAGATPQSMPLTLTVQ